MKRVGLAVAVAALLLVASGAQAATPAIDIHSAGPLSDIYIGNDLSCQVRSGGFSSTEFFPNASGPGDCGTFLFITPDGNSGFLGPDFQNHAGGTHTTGNLNSTEMPFTPVSQSLTGSGTAASPYRVTTVVSSVNGSLNLTFTEVDTYVVGNNFFQTDVTVANTSAAASLNGELYHAADCQLRGDDNGFGEFPPQSSPNTASCTPNVLGNPPSAIEELVPLTTTTGQSWEQTQIGTPGVGGLWADLNGSALQNSCLQCRGTAVDTGIGIGWPVALAAGKSATFSFQTVIVDTVPKGGFSFAGPAGSAVGGTVATITDPNTSATPSAYSAMINWGDGSSSAGTVGGGNGSFSVTGNHSYVAGGTYPITVTITAVGTNQGSSAVTDSATITARPAAVITGAPTVSSSTKAGFAGSVNPEGLPTTTHFEYGLDSRYSKPGTSGPVYDHSTPSQSVGSDFTSHAVTASVSGLVPNALYHVRLVATNAAGTTNGPDMTFKTDRGPVPGPPGLGKTFNVSSTGLVLIKVHGVFIPLTELTKIPNGTLINALKGTLTLTTAVPGGTQHAAIAATKKAKKPKTKTQTGKFGGAVFQVTQAHSGLATLSLVEGKVKGGPSYASCTTKKGKAVTAALSKKTLQLLHGSAHGKFRSKGRYAAATVRGTIWTIADRCDGTLTHAIKDTVSVSDFVRHKTIILRPGHSYLALAKPRHKRK
ncbi:MAG: hypothetical protein ACXVHC_00450 [Frankiaceae bacterium]